MSRSPVIPMLKLYGLFWLALFLFAATAMLVSNGVFGVAWFSVADVALSLAIFVAAAVIAGLAIMIVLAIASGRVGRAIVMVFAGTIYALLPFAAILALAVYAYVSPVPLSGVSFVLEQFENVQQAAIDAVGRALPSTDWRMPERAMIDNALLVLSGGFALLALAANWLTARRSLDAGP